MTGGEVGWGRGGWDACTQGVCAAAPSPAGGVAWVEMVPTAPPSTQPSPNSPPHPRCHAPPPCLSRQDPKACSVVLRGASKDVLNEVERNLHDAMGVARNVCIGGCGRRQAAWCGEAGESSGWEYWHIRACAIGHLGVWRLPRLGSHTPPRSAAFHPLPALSPAADPRLVPGGGAVEMAVSRGLAERANSGAVEGVEQVGPPCSLR